jgi:hypothetical protein
MLVGDKAGTGHPYGPEEVYRRQARPSQRSAFRRAATWLLMYTSTALQSFMKREAYGKVTAPRNIIPTGIQDKVLYSEYIYAFSDNVTKVQPWYAFSKTPRAVAQKLMELCLPARWVIETDFSKFDGTHGRTLHEFELRCLLAYFHPDYHKDIRERHNATANKNGYTKFGVWFYSAYLRITGRADTSDFNSSDNALVSYCSLRERWQDPEVAYSKLGLYGGDDGVSPDMDCDTYERVAGYYGLKLKAKKVFRGDTVSFLSRWYSTAIWEGDMGSMTELNRQVSKLHLTPSPVVAKTEVTTETIAEDIGLQLYRKALGYYLTDRFAPFLGAWSRRVIELYTGLSLGRNSLAQVQTLHDDLLSFQPDLFTSANYKYWEKFDFTEQYPQITDTAESYQLASRMFELEPSEIEAMEREALAATSFMECFPKTTRFNKSMVVEIRAVLGDTIVGEEHPYTTAPTQKRKGPRPARTISSLHSTSDSASL